jgi:hypothetical protein
MLLFAMNIKSIAPCGMNCGICMAYLREKKKCPGCRGADDDKSISCVRCKIKNCDNIKKHRFCFECDKFPCELIRHIDKRYRTKYGMGMIENLGNIKKLGIRKFVKNEKIRWKCPDCGGIINVHRWCCSGCGKKRIS